MLVKRLANIDESVVERDIPPHAPQAERAVISAVLTDVSVLEELSDILVEEDFYAPAHRALYRALCALKEAGEPTDSVTVCEHLRFSGLLERVGGPGFVEELASQVSTTREQALGYAHLVREQAARRRLRSMAQVIERDTRAEGGRSSGETIERIEEALLDVERRDGRAKRGYANVADLLPGLVDHVQELADRGEAIIGLPSGFKKLDGLLAGLHAGDLVIIAGRPSMGKTSLAMNIAEHVALEARKAVSVFSMEMSQEQLTQRTVSSVGGIDSQRLRTGQLEERDWVRLTATAARLQDAQILIDETGALTPAELRSRARRMKREHDVALLVVDYLQLMDAGAKGSAENRSVELGEITRALKALAKELQVPVLALSQLNRAVEQRADKRPVMSDLRDSGSLEQDADVILLVYRDEVYNPESPAKGTAEIIVAKHRNGPTGTVMLGFEGQHVRFTNDAVNNTYV